MSTTTVPGLGNRHNAHKFLSSKVIVVAIISLAAVLSFAEAPAPPDFTLSASPASIRVPRNGKGSAIITTAITHDFSSTVNLTTTGVPVGATVTFSQSSISSPGAGSSALTISVGSSTPLGTYSVTVTGSGGGDTKSATVTLTVVPSQSLPTGYGWHQLANTNMTSVCLGNVPNGMYSDPTMTTTTNYNFNCNQIIPWSGAAADDTHQRLIVWGGGHRDYGGNEVSVLSLTGTPSWQAFTSPTMPIPYVADQISWEGLKPYYVSLRQGGQYQPGASPSSRHTYTGLQYVPYQNKLYSFGGAIANNGGFSKETWTLDMGTAAWTMVGPPFTTSPTYPTTAYNPSNGHIVMHDKDWNLLDFDPNTDNWTTLTNNYHVDDGTAAAIDPVNNLFVVVGAAGSYLGYPSLPTSHTVQVFPLTQPYTMLTWSDPSCDLIYRNSGLAWDSVLGLMVGYPGGGNQVYLLNTGTQDVVTPFGNVPSHQCLDVPITLNPSPVKGVDYPQDPEGTSSSNNIGIFGRFAYFPSLDTFVVVNDRTQNAWTLQLTGGSPAPSFAASTSPGAVTVAEGSQGTAVISTTVSGGFNNAIALWAAGMPVGTTVSFTPSTIAAPGAGSSTVTFNVGASTAAGTYPIAVSAYGGGDTVNTLVTLTVTAVGQPNFTISGSPPSLSIVQGNQGTSTITTAISGGFNSAISLSASGMPSGTTVTFNPSTIPAPGTGASTMTVTVGASTPTGTYPITVTGNGGGIQQNATVTLTVSVAGQPNFTISGSPASLSVVQGNQGTSTITAAISGGFNNSISLSSSGAPTGTTVSFNPGTIPAPGAGTSNMAITVGSSTAAGTYPITVTGSGGGIKQTTTITLTVTAAAQPNFSIYAAPSLVSIAQGNQGGSTIATAISGGFNSPISLSASGIPSGTTVSFNPVTIPAPGAGTSNMTITVGGSTPTGTYPITVTGSGGGIKQSTTVTLTVTAGAPPNFTISALPASLSIQQGNQGTSTLTTTISGGFNSAISLSASGAPTGTTVSFNPSTIPAPGAGSSVMIITVGSSTPVGTYPITVTGNGGGTQQNATVTLTVTAQQQNYDVGIDFRSTQNYAGDPAYAVFGNCGNDGTTPQTRTNANGQSITWQWSRNCNLALDRSNGVDPRLAGIANLYTASGGETLTITVPQPGTYNIAFATGNAASNQCGGGNCPNFIFRDGASGTQLFTVNPNNPGLGHFIDATNNNWTAAQWPSSNQQKQVTLTGTTLTLSMAASNAPNIAHIRITYAQQQQKFSISATPASLSIQQGNQGSSTISGRFGNSTVLSASGVPVGAAVSFNPQTIPSPGSGSSTMNITVGSSTPTGTYPIAVTGNGGGTKQTTTVTLTVTAVNGTGWDSSQTTTGSLAGTGQQYDVGMDFRGTQNYVSDPAYAVFDNCVNDGTNQQTRTNANGISVTWQWSQKCNMAVNESNGVDSRLAGIANVYTASGGETLTLTVPQPGAYYIGFATGNAVGNQCGGGNCPNFIFRDGSSGTQLFTVNPNNPGLGHFIDAANNNWMAAQWPASNQQQQVTLTGTTLTVSMAASNAPSIAHIRITSAQPQPNFTISASPASLSIQQGNQGTSTITTTVSGGFNSAISLSATGAPSGTTVSFNPSTIPAPGSGSSTMTITVASNTPTGTYPITVTGNGGGIQQNATVTLTVTAAPNFTISASPASLSIQQGNQGTSTITTTISNGFNSAISLSASGMPSGTTVAFNPITIAAPGAGTSTMTITVGGSTPTGTYPIIVAGNGGGIQQNATVNLTVTTQQRNYDVGIDFRGTQNFASDPAYAVFDNCGNDGTTPQTRTNANGISVTWQWSQKCNLAVNESNGVDPRLAGIANVYTASGGETLTLTVPQPGVYYIGFATGNALLNQCGGGNCPNFIFQDGASGTQLFTVNPNNPGLGHFIDAANNNWTAAQWPSGNQQQLVTLTGTTLTVSMAASNAPSIAHIRITSAQPQPNFTMSASPASLSIQQGNQGTSTITTTVSGGFNSAISLSATGAPSGTTVSFNPSTIPAPGSGTSTMTITVGASTPTGTYPITVTGNGGGIQQNTTVTLTVTAQAQPNFTISASPASLSIQQGNQGTSTITTTVSGGFNSAISLSATGAPTGTTVSFNPSTIPAPGSGASTMTITLGASTPTGTYPITVTGNGGGIQQNATVNLSVTTSGGGGAGNGITVSDLSGSGQTNRFVSVGRFFKQGDIPHFAQAVVGGTALLTQCDVKNRWPDGSLKFGIVSFILPSVSTSGTQVTFQNQGTGNNTGFLVQSDMLDPAYDFDGVMQLTGKVSPSISARSMLQDGSFQYWLQGPIVTAVIIEDRAGRTYDVNTDGGTGNPLHPIFEAWFYPQGRKVDLGFTLENAWASSTAANSARDQTLGFTLTTGSASPATRLTQASFNQWAFTKWHQDFWVGSGPAAIGIDYGAAYLLQTGAYPNYDLTVGNPANAVVTAYNSMKANYPARFTIPGFNDASNGGMGMVDQVIDATGDSEPISWIGLYPEWDIALLVSSDARLVPIVQEEANLAGRWPMWFREADHNAGSGHYFDYPATGTIDPYGHPVSINARQQVTLAAGNFNIYCSGGGADYISTTLSGNAYLGMDPSHSPDFGYIPYTLFGKYYYYEQEQMEGAFMTGFYVGCYNLAQDYWRQGYLGLQTNGGRVRDNAWALRSMAYASFTAIDGQPEAAYFRDKVKNTLAYFEGFHNLALDLTDTTDRTVAYNWGKNTWLYTMASNVSPLHGWENDATTQTYAYNCADNNCTGLSSAGSMFQESFLDITLGMIRQLGVANTDALLTFNARRPFHTLLDPSMNHYLIQQYVYPLNLADGSWVPDWSSFQSHYSVLPTGWYGSGNPPSGATYGVLQLSAVSFLVPYTVDGYSGQAAWNWFKANNPNVPPPRWSIKPFGQ